MSGKGKRRPNYGSMRGISSNGYAWVRIPGHPLADKDGAVATHRLVIWNSGIDPRGKMVHHKNGNKLDNRRRNLELMNGSEHRKQHGPIKNQYGIFQLREKRPAKFSRDETFKRNASKRAQQQWRKVKRSGKNHLGDVG